MINHDYELERRAHPENFGPLVDERDDEDLEDSLRFIETELSECCKAPMIGGRQCEGCGSNGKFCRCGNCDFT